MSTRVLSTRPRTLTVLMSGTLLLAGCAGSPESDSNSEADTEGFPVEISACDFTATLDAPPERAVTLSQGATEVMLALGLEDHMVGTAYLDDAVPAEFQEAYESIPVLSEEFPTNEELREATPDFVYSSYISAYEPDAVGTQDELADADIASYVSPFGCPADQGRAETSFESVWAEVDAVADAFGVPERAEELRAEQEESLAAIEEGAAGEGLRVFWYDSGQDSAFAGAGEGGPQLILDAIGAENVFADTEGGWADVPWEDVVAADPDVIVLADAAWDTAADKVSFLENDPVLSQLRAVRAGAFVTLPFSATTPGVRLVEGAETVNEQISGLAG